jgi:hypothetical protein
MQKTFKYFVLFPLAAAWLCCSGLICDGPDGGNHPPDVRNAAVNPSPLAFEGGDVTITADATDPDGDALTVETTVRKPDGAMQTIPLTKGTGSQYRGTYIAPGNPTRSAQTYEIRVTASDGVASDTDPPVRNLPVRLTVNPAESPPDEVQF